MAPIESAYCGNEKVEWTEVFIPTKIHRLVEEMALSTEVSKSEVIGTLLKEALTARSKIPNQPQVSLARKLSTNFG